MSSSALIVAHGQPADPAPPEADMAALAEKVGLELPGWTVRGATLAAQGALEKALSLLHDPIIFPFFMADGWFTKTELPRRLAAAGRSGLPVRPAFGLLPDVPPLARRLALAAARSQGWHSPDTTLVLIAHGSGRSRAPAEVVRRIASEITGFRETRVGFIEETPTVEEAARHTGSRAVCLPLLVAKWQHVIADIPKALDAAGFTGLRLDPIGASPAVPAIIAAAIRGAS